MNVTTSRHHDCISKRTKTKQEYLSRWQEVRFSWRVFIGRSFRVKIILPSCDDFSLFIFWNPKQELQKYDQQFSRSRHKSSNAGSVQQHISCWRRRRRPASSIKGWWGYPCSSFSRKQCSESIVPRSEISVRGGVSEPESDRSTLVDDLDPLYGLTFNLFPRSGHHLCFYPPSTFSQRLPVPFQVAAAWSKLLPSGAVDFNLRLSEHCCILRLSVLVCRVEILVCRVENSLHQETRLFLYPLSLGFFVSEDLLRSTWWASPRESRCDI